MSSSIQIERPCVATIRSLPCTWMSLTGTFGQIELERLPVPAVVERDVHAELGAGVEQPLAVRVLAHHARRRVGGDAVLAVGQALPRLAVVVGPVDVRRVVAEQVPVDGVVRRARAVRRHVDERDAPALGQVLRRHVRPRLAVVPRQVERAVVRAHPDHAGLVRRLRDRVQRAVELLAGDVAGDRLAADALAAGGVGGEVRARSSPTSRPCRACGAGTASRSRGCSGRAATSPSATRAGSGRIRSLAGLPYSDWPPTQYCFAWPVRRSRTSNCPLHEPYTMFSLGRMRHDRPRLAPRARPPVDVHLAAFGHAGDDVRAVVLLRAVEAEREAVVDVDAVDLGRRLVVLRRPRAARRRRRRSRRRRSTGSSCSQSLGLTQMSWLSPCGVCMRGPASRRRRVDLKKLSAPT